MSVIEARAVRAMPIQLVVDDEEWQLVRLSLIGYWGKNHHRNLRILQEYLDKHPDCPYALRRVYNVMTGSVHRTGYTRGQAATDAFRLRVRVAWRRMCGDSTDGLRGEI